MNWDDIKSIDPRYKSESVRGYDFRPTSLAEYRAERVRKVWKVLCGILAVIAVCAFIINYLMI